MPLKCLEKSAKNNQVEQRTDRLVVRNSTSLVNLGTIMSQVLIVNTVN